MMFEQPANEAPSLADYLRAIKSRKWFVLGASVLGLVLGLSAYSYSTPQFEASARILIGPSRRLSLDSGRAVAANAERERELLFSDAVLERAATSLGLDLDAINERLSNSDAIFIPDSDVITVNATDSDQAAAAEVVNEVAAAYVDVTEQAEIDFFQIRIDGLDAELISIADGIETLDSTLAELTAQRQAILSLPAEDPSREGLLLEVDAERSASTTSVNQLIVSRRVVESDIRELRTDLATRTPTAAMVSPAAVPTSPVGFSRNILGALGLFLGTSAGVAGAFVLARLDRRANTTEEIERALGRRVLSSIPSFGRAFSDLRGREALVMASDSSSSRVLRAVEGFRRLRTSVDFISEADGHQTLLFTSAYPAEGKSTVCANLGISLAKSGKRTALVSADLRRPSLERLFGVEAQAGLSQWLGGADDVDLLVELETENLYILPAGLPAMNSSELLGSDRFKLLIEELERSFDIVLVDSPPVLATADAGAAAKHVDGVVVVVDSRSTEVQQLTQLRYDLDRGGSNLIGAVLNRERQRRAMPWRKKDRYTYAYKS